MSESNTQLPFRPVPINRPGGGISGRIPLSTSRTCCYIPCTKPAIWLIYEGLATDDYTESCNEHLSYLLSDKPQHHVYRISPAVDMEDAFLTTLDGMPEEYRAGMKLGASLYIDHLQAAYDQLKAANKPVESIGVTEACDRITKVAEYNGLTTHQTARFISCLLAVGLEIAETAVLEELRRAYVVLRLPDEYGEPVWRCEYQGVYVHNNTAVGALNAAFTNEVSRIVGK